MARKKAKRIRIPFELKYRYRSYHRCWTDTLKREEPKEGEVANYCGWTVWKDKSDDNDCDSEIRLCRGGVRQFFELPRGLEKFDLIYSQTRPSSDENYYEFAIYKTTDGDWYEVGLHTDSREPTCLPSWIHDRDSDDWQIRLHYTISELLGDIENEYHNTTGTMSDGIDRHVAGYLWIEYDEPQETRRKTGRQ